MSNHDYDGCHDQACDLCDAYGDGYAAGKDKARWELRQSYDRDYHKFEDCQWTGVNDPMCWLCFRYATGFKDAITHMSTCIANGVSPNDSLLLQSVLRRHGAWALKLELAKWEGGGYPDRAEVPH